MMNVRHHSIVLDDGAVVVMQTVQQPDGSWPSVEECIGKWHPQTRARVMSHRHIEPSEVPQDRTFRDAWADTGKIAVNMDKAREIHRGRMRAARSSLLTALDVEYQRADEIGDQRAKADITAKKQRLRDVTTLPEIDTAETPEQLKACWPDYLNGR